MHTVLPRPSGLHPAHESGAPDSSSGSRGLGAVRFGLVAAIAFLTLVDLFAAQAILPALTVAYAVTPAAMGVAVNASTLGMAVAGLGVALFNRRIPRRNGILVSLVLLAIPTTLLAVAPDLMTFTALRVAQGLCMATAFSLTLAHLGETAGTPASAFAAYITGNVASNLVGRLAAAAVAGHLGLPATFLAFAALNLAGAVLVAVTIPAGSRASLAPPGLSAWGAVLGHLRTPRLLAAFAIGFCILFAFIGTFTYVNFVLVHPPLSLGMMALGLVYCVFLPSIVTTPLAGGFATRWGVRPAFGMGLVLAVAGLPLTLSSALPAVMAGLALVGVGTFFAQAVVTGFVGRAASSEGAAASGLYLASYFGGGLAGSAVLGRLFDTAGWPACVAGIGSALLLALLLGRFLVLPPSLQSPSSDRSEPMIDTVSASVLPGPDLHHLRATAAGPALRAARSRGRAAPCHQHWSAGLGPC